MNNSVPFDPPLFSGNDSHYAYGTHNPALDDPEEILLGREAFQERLRVLEGQLSGFEARILRLYLNGLSYSEIAAEVNRSPKSVDNAVQRIRRKAARHLTSGDLSRG